MNVKLKEAFFYAVEYPSPANYSRLNRIIDENAEYACANGIEKLKAVIDYPIFYTKLNMGLQSSVKENLRKLGKKMEKGFIISEPLR
jgi:hypothetical protein